MNVMNALLLVGLFVLFVGPLVVAYFVYQFMMKRIKEYEASQEEEVPATISNRALQERIEQLERRVDELEKRK